MNIIYICMKIKTYIIRNQNRIPHRTNNQPKWKEYKKKWKENENNFVRDKANKS